MRSCSFLVAFTALLACACAPAEPPLNVLLVVSDSLRADALDCSGGTARSPYLCGLVERGVRFDRAYATAPWTLPSSIALFTGNLPVEYSQTGGEPGRFFWVGDDEELLAELLAERGYRVAAFVENGLAQQANALQGFTSLPFDRAESGEPAALEERLGFDARRGRLRRVLGMASALLAAGDRPFFFLQWIADPHDAYDPPAEGLAELDTTGLAHPVEYYAKLGGAALRAYLRRISPPERDLLRQLYAKEVESVDRRVGLMLRALDRAGLVDRTIVVFTSDHGEGFGEHGLYLHGNSLYDELLRVPLLMAGPGIVAGRRVSSPISHVDLVPTLAELLGVKAPQGVRGRSLAALLRPGARPPAERALFAASLNREHRADALVAGRHKLIEADGGAELYDLSIDPGERHDLAGRSPELTRSLVAQLGALRRENEARRARRRDLGAPADRDRIVRDTREQLEALGYVE